MAKARDSLEEGLDALYAAPLAAFVTERDALATSLGSSGRSADAARVKALRKPAASAWAVNRLALTQPKLVASLVASGDRLRKGPSPQAMQERRETLNEARRAAERELAAAGHAATADVLRRVAATLEAIAAYGSAAGRPPAGRLTEDVPAPGFDEIAALGLIAGGRAKAPAASRGAAPPAARKAGAAAPDALKERAAEGKRRREAQRVLEHRTAEAKAARARLTAAERSLDALRRKKAALEASLAAAVAEERRLEAALAGARAASAAAEAAEREAREAARG